MEGINKPQEENEDPGNKSIIEEITKKCMDAEGYVLFTGHITAEKDSKGGPVIQWNYRRYHFSFDNMDGALKQFKEFYKGDVIENIK